MDGKTIRDKLVGSDDERAVSPVIGVILMVAITVILAAVIATLVMDFGDSVEESVNAGVTIENESGTAVVTWVDGGNADEIRVTASGSGNVGNPTGSSPLTAVGESLEVSGSGSVTITATAVTDDGSETVVQSETYTLS